MKDVKSAILNGKTFLGIELGSTRIKAVLVDDAYNPVATGGYDWENRFENKVWTYRLDDVWTGLRASFAAVSKNVMEKYGVPLTTTGGIGISAMMHGYLVFDKDGNQLAQFRTWRNTMTEEAAVKLTKAFNFNIPQRWSAAHIYHAVLNGESHVKDIARLTTLACYIHEKLTGQNVIGMCEASGMFPIDSTTKTFNAAMLEKFDELVAEYNVGWKLSDILPKVLDAGTDAGTLTEEGAKLLDPSGQFKAGAPMCPPEGDAGTGMVATNSVAPRTGNVSAGTSIFAMIVLEKGLSRLHEEIDMITTPSGSPVAMVHCNNCTPDFDEWARLLGEAIKLSGGNISKPGLYDLMYEQALKGDADCGGLLSYNYLSGEHLTGFEQGRPLFARTPDSRFTLANMMRTLLFSTMATLKLGMDILTLGEKVRLDALLGHGGLFKTELAGQKLMAGAINVPVAVMESAGEGGAWGIALLAAYMVNKSGGENLEDFLMNKVFANNKSISVNPDPEDVESFKLFMRRYKDGLAIERAAVENLKS